MSELLNAWPQIREALSPNPMLQGLVDSCVATYDGVYTLSTPAETFPTLAASYPDLAQQVFSITQQPLRVQIFGQHTTSETGYALTGETDPHSKKRAKPHISIPPVSPSTESILLSAGASTVTDAILQPESIAAVPIYLLRFIPYVGTDAVLVAIALRQAFYRFGKTRGPEGESPKAGDKVSLEVERILGMLGGAMSRATYFRLMKSGALDWFVTNLGSGHQVVRGQVQRLPNQYQYRGALLTPGDASDLAEFLLSEGLRENPGKALAAALATPRNQVLQFPYRAPKGEGFSEALSVPDLLRQLLPQTRLTGELLSLCDALSTALIRPESFLAVPWYWFRKVLPAMGTDLGGLYLMARACGYTDWASGKDRDHFWVQGGEATLQAWVRSKSLPRMIPTGKSSSAGRPRKEAVQEQSGYVRTWRERSRELAQGYLLRCATRPGKADPKQADWQLRVGQTSLTSEDLTLRDAIYAFLCAADQADPALPAALRALRQNSGLQNALLAAAHYRGEETPLDTLSQNAREVGKVANSSCQCEEQGRRSNQSSAFPDLSRSYYHEWNKNQIATQKKLAMTESIDGHCEEQERRSNLSSAFPDLSRSYYHEWNKNQIATQKRLAMTESIDGHCEEQERRINLSSALLERRVRETGVIDHSATISNLPGTIRTSPTTATYLICHFETLVQEGICHSETLDEQAICHFETLRQALNCYFETLVAAEICDFETVIQILLRLKNTDFYNQDISNTEDPRQLQPGFELETSTQKAEVEENSDHEEEFAQLLAKIDPRKAQEIREKGLKTQFVAWVIYGAMNEKIHDPLNLAVAKTLVGAQVPNPACLELAALGEAALLEELETSQRRQKRGYFGGEKWLNTNADSHLTKLIADEAQKLSGILKFFEPYKAAKEPRP